MSPTSFQCQLHCSHTIRHCFGLLEKCNAHSDFNIKQQDAQLSNLDCGFFECLPVATSTSSTTSVTTIVLKIYHSRSIYGGGSSKSWLILNEEFAKLNELKHGNMLLLLPVQKYNRCKQVELYPFTNDDFKAIAYSASAIEELFLSQINVVRSDMLFPIFMFQDSSIKFKIKVPDSSMEQNYLLDKDTRISICSPLNTTDNKTDVQKSVELSTENIKTDMDIKIEETDCEFRVEQDIRNFIWPRASSCFYRVLPSNILANFKQFPASEEDVNPFLAPEYEFSSLANSLPFLFILRRSETFKEQAYFVEIIEGSQNQLVCAILIEISIDEQKIIYRPFLREIAESLERANNAGIAHCILAPGLRRLLPNLHAEFVWLQVQQIPIERLRTTNQITIKSSPLQIPGTKKWLSRLFSASALLYTPWLVPATNDGLSITFGYQNYQIQVDEPISSSKNCNNDFYHFFWPLSPTLCIQYRECTTKKDSENTEDHEKRAESEESTLFPFSNPVLKELAIGLHNTIKSSVLYFIRDQIWCRTSARHLQLIGPVGSGKTTILSHLAKMMPKIEYGLGIGCKIIDCSGKIFGELLKEIKDALSTLTSCWPALLLLDNFDAIAGQDMASESDEQTILRRRKIYKNIVSLISTAQQILVVYSVSDPRKLQQKELLRLPNGEPFFVDCFKIADSSKSEHDEILGGFLASEQPAKPPNINEIMQLTTVGDLLQLVGRIQFHSRREKITWNNISETVKIGDNLGVEEASIPIKFEQIAGLTKIKQKLTEIFLWPSKYPKLFAHAGISKRAILHGPSGCGKSILMRALAAEMGVPVFWIRGPELYSKYVGQSEQKMRELFTKAKSNRPSLVIFDEFDALAPQRGSDNAHVTDRLVNLLLTELDGFEEDTEDLFICCATNRLDLIDQALLRPGRFEHKICVTRPDLVERTALLRLYAHSGHGVVLSDNVNLKLIAEQTEGHSCAEMRAIVQNALMEAEAEKVAEEGEESAKDVRICQKHLNMAVKMNRKEKLKEGRIISSGLAQPRQKLALN